jgi:small subunit ribosomal protein S6
MRRYETFIILDPDLSEEGRQPVIVKINDLVTQEGGLLVLKDEWGARKLAYEIKKKTRGYYIRFDYCGTGPLVSEIERSCRIDDRVLKYMTVLTEDDVDVDRIKKDMEDAEAEKKAAELAAKEKEKEKEPRVSDPVPEPAEATSVSEPAETTVVSESAEATVVSESAETTVSDEAETKESQNDVEEQPNE